MFLLLHSIKNHLSHRCFDLNISYHLFLSGLSILTYLSSDSSGEASMRDEVVFLDIHIGLLAPRYLNWNWQWLLTKVHIKLNCSFLWTCHPLAELYIAEQRAATHPCCCHRDCLHRAAPETITKYADLSGDGKTEANLALFPTQTAPSCKLRIREQIGLMKTRANSLQSTHNFQMKWGMSKGGTSLGHRSCWSLSGPHCNLSSHLDSHPHTVPSRREWASIVHRTQPLPLSLGCLV